MKKCIVRALLAALLLGLLAGAQAEPTALDAFYALMAGEDGQAQAASGDDCLDRVMAGEFAAQPGDDAARAALAAQLEPLAAVTSRDIAAYAAEHGLPVAQVRNAWYRALAGALEAELAVNPAAGEEHRNALAILALFIEPDADGSAAADRQAIRGQMTPEYGQRIAEQSSLPVQFVDFVIMSEDWDDDDWENDDDWQEAFDWDDEFDDIVVGSRDGGGSTRIADLQSQLINLGYLKGKADGVFGPRTQAALLEFQLANGLKGTGAYSAKSLRALESDGAVARWDYGEDFWDSDDTPDTPDTPDKADTPDTPDKVNTPDTPDKVNTPDTPDKVNTPDTPDKVNTPDTPDKVNTPDTPDKVNTPDTPDKKDSPDSPDTPD